MPIRFVQFHCANSDDPKPLWINPHYVESVSEHKGKTGLVMEGRDGEVFDYYVKETVDETICMLTSPD